MGSKGNRRSLGDEPPVCTSNGLSGHLIGSSFQPNEILKCYIQAQFELYQWAIKAITSLQTYPHPTPGLLLHVNFRFESSLSALPLECPLLSESPSSPPVHLQQFPVTRRDSSDGSALSVRVSAGYRAVQSSRISHVDYFGPWDDQSSLEWLLGSDGSWLQSALAPCTWWPSSLNEPSWHWFSFPCPLLGGIGDHGLLHVIFKLGSLHCIVFLWSYMKRICTRSKTYLPTPSKCLALGLH